MGAEFAALGVDLVAISPDTKPEPRGIAIPFTSRPASRILPMRSMKSWPEASERPAVMLKSTRSPVVSGCLRIS